MMTVTTETDSYRPTGWLTAVWLAVLVGLLNVIMGIVTLPLARLNGISGAELLDPGSILAVSFSAVGALIAARRAHNPIGWIFLAIGCSQGLVAFAYQYATYTLITNPGMLPGGAPMAVLGQLAWIPGLHLMLTYALLLFPTGRLPSPRWRVVGWISAIPLLIFPYSLVWAWPYGGRTLLENPEQLDPRGGGVALLLALVFPLTLLCGLASVTSLIFRFRQARDVERQQLKWFTYAATITFTAIVADNFLSDYLGSLEPLLLAPIIPSIPAAAGIAILRYHLYDIDVLIRRTLVYSVLTVLLALVYFGSVVLLQSLVATIEVEQSTSVIVFSTLAIAALFSPLRKRVQEVIDRRFYRRKYDAAQTLAAFATTARDEVDLEVLTAELLRVVEETMRPAHVWLWLRELET